MVVFFLGSQGATLKFYLEGAKTIQVFLGEDLAWALTDCCFDFVTSWFFLGSQGATLKFYLEGAKTIQVCLGEDLA